MPHSIVSVQRKAFLSPWMRARNFTSRRFDLFRSQSWYTVSAVALPCRMAITDVSVQEDDQTDALLVICALPQGELG